MARSQQFPNLAGGLTTVDPFESHMPEKAAGVCEARLRELVEDHRITVPYVNTHENMADFFTKPLAWEQFRKLRDRIMNV